MPQDTLSETNDEDDVDDVEDVQDLIAAAIEDASHEAPEPLSGENSTPGASTSTTPDIQDDGAEEVPHQRSSAILEAFSMLMALWFEHVGVSRNGYAALLQILLMLESIDPIKALPKTLDLLKQQFKGQFPLLPMRRKKIPVVSTKLPTLSAAERGLVNSATCWLHFQDPIALLTNVARSPKFRSTMHHGMAHFVDEPAELWESFSWASSIRSTSGEFAQYADGSPIFVSDVVNYRCIEPLCSCSINTEKHIGRVRAVGKDFTSGTKLPGAFTIVIYPYIRQQEAPRELLRLISRSKKQPPFAGNELIVHETSIGLLESDIIGHITDIFFDKKFGDKHSTQIVPHPATRTYVRRAVNKGLSSISPICRTSPTRGELEVQTYGREHLVETFQANKCLSVPYQLFIDGFGLYRNMYRSVMGIYMIPACLSAAERAKMSNIYPIALGPHGSNFDDVITALKRLSTLESGIDVARNNLKSGETRLVAFCSAYLGDMPQQQDNAGFKRPTAKVSCRSCLVEEKDRDDLDYNIQKKGRYHYHTLSTRAFIEREPSGKQDGLLREYGLSSRQTPLFNIAPSLNLDAFFPSDPCHSEYAGISKLAHSLLVDTILSKKGQDRYSWHLRRFQFPAGWARLQTPINHLNSYQLQEHARASVILPLLLRIFLKESWIAPGFRSTLSKSYTSPIDEIVRVFARIAKSNSVLVSKKLTQEDRKNLLDIIQNARLGLQALIEVAAASDKRKEAEYRRMKIRPNMHVGIHYPQQAEEYSLPYNSNVLAGENKHR